MSRKKLLEPNPTLIAENGRLRTALSAKERHIQKLQFRLDACLYAMVLMREKTQEIMAERDQEGYVGPRV